MDHPADYTGRSLSVSDVIVIKEENRQTAYYVDRIGYQKMPEFFAEKLQNEKITVQGFKTIEDMLDALKLSEETETEKVDTSVNMETNGYQVDTNSNLDTDGNDEIADITKEPEEDHADDLPEIVYAENPTRRLSDNIDAISTLKYIEANYGDGYVPNEYELRQFRKYAGWGGLAKVFDEDNHEFDMRRNQLKNLLTEDEYKAARASTLNAHYTPQIVIDAMYKAIKEMELPRNARILEPACGTGNFITRLPASLSDAEVVGVELDSLTARLAHYINNGNINVSIINSAFENSGVEDNAYDLAIGNVPFGNYKLLDPDHANDDWFIHDAFFRKALDKVAPGGVVAFITSTGTLDKKNPKIREYLAERSDLIGAIRLPNNTFDDAGTKTASDIIFLQKRKEPRLKDDMPDWCYTMPNEDGLNINSYFVQNPQMILGKMEQTTHFNMLTCSPLPDADLSRQLDEAIRNLNAKIRVDKREKAVAERQSMIEPWGKNFTYQIKDNDVFYREGNTMHEVKCRTKAEKERLMLLCDIRSAARELIDLQSTSISDEELAPYRDKLNELYDRHKAKYGDLTSGKTNKLFSRDSDCAIVQSLEDINDNTNEHTKAAIFTERTVVPQTEITEAATLEDALQYSLDRKGKIDLIYMAELLKDVYQGDNVAGTIRDELIDKGYAFMDPDKIIAGEPYTGIVDSVEYLSGNVRQKLNTAMEYAENHPEYQRNVEALTKVIPEDIKIDEITVQMGCSWIDAEDYTKFLAHLSGRSAYSKFGEVSYSALTGEFTVTNSRARTGFNVNESQTYGTQNFSLYALAEKILNQRRIAVNIQVPNPKDPSKNVTRTDVKATKIANDVAKKIKQEFKKWIFADEARREKYERRYNNIFNSLVGRSYDGSKLTFPGLKSDFVLRSHQKNCVARTIYGGNTLAAHVVGAGKSAVIITSVMKKKELGLINKACVVVPKPLTEQTAAEWRKMYPGARLLTVTAADLNKEDKRKIFTAKVATGSYDAVIMSQEQFAKLQMTDEYRAEYIQKEIDELEENLREAKGQNGSRYSVKDIETKKKDLQNRLIKVTAPKSKTTEKDDLLDFENLGFDYLVVDEAHAYKNAFVITKMSDVAGVTTKPSDRAEDMQMKTDYFNEKFGQGHILFATGTPVSNSMTELYVMTRYLRPDLLKAQGIDRFDDWASTFGQVVTKNQQTSSGTLKLKTKFASFANLPELMAMYKEFADVQSAEKLNLPRPRLKDDKVQIIKAPATKEQKAYVKELADRALAYESGLVDSTKDNHLVITGEARLVGLGNMVLKSLYEKREKELPEDFIIEKNSKVDLCVEKVAELYNKTNETKGVQIIFSDIAVNSDDGNFSVYDYIKSELIEKGIPADEIIFAPKSDAKNREQIFADINSSKYRVVIASTSTLGTGANIQQNLYALHHVDIPWKPSDFTQREGRILRQGNNNPEVEIFNYVTEGTLDSYLYQTVTDKARFIAQLLDNNAPARVSEDCDEKVLTFAEIQAAAEGNPDFKRRIEISNEIAELTMLKGEYDRETAKTREQLKNYPGQIERYQTKLEKCKTDTATAKAFIGTDLTVKTHDGRTLTDKKEINSYIVGLAQKQRFAASSSPKFEVNDFTVNLSTREIDTNGMMFSDGPHVDFNIHGADTYTSEAGHVENSDNYIRLTNFFEKTLPGKIEKLEAAIAETENNMHQAEERIAAPFDHEEELEKLQTEFNELEEKLAGLSEQKDDFTDSDEIGVITPDEKKTDINELMDDEDDMSNSRRP
ncbi:MAG: DEAD/DEAH box helicase family protein [Oscillospiraceae bacterium]|nr:DEAD/DEAH box helicase family protein [Oscillospiraceae bacterium]